MIKEVVMKRIILIGLMLILTSCATTGQFLQGFGGGASEQLKKDQKKSVTYTTYGNTISGSDGSNCTFIGNTVTCN
jgi:hypothetical protein